MAMSGGTIDFSIDDSVATLTLNQPSRHNALTLDMWCILPQLVVRAEASSDVRLIVVTGAGDAAFSAGADISEFAEKRSSPGSVEHYDEAVRVASDVLRQSRLPTLALIKGVCFGGGVGLALCCDLRSAHADARFRIPAGRLGIGYGYGDIAPLVHRVGPGAAAEILFTAAIFDADHAKRLGLVQHVFGQHEFNVGVRQQIDTIIDNAPLTLRAAKKALIEIEKPESERSLAGVEQSVAACFESRDFKEGRSAFLEKRKPQFRGV
jgi:enoyl-CoA hydratase